MKNLKQRIETVLSNRLSGLSISEQLIRNSLDYINLIKKPSEWTEEDLLILSKQIRTRSKPIILAANKADISSSDINIEKLKNLKRSFFPTVCEAELLLRRALIKI